MKNAGMIVDFAGVFLGWLKSAVFVGLRGKSGYSC
jgi:hypothetical protein